jgi:hypothetical protein
MVRGVVALMTLVIPFGIATPTYAGANPAGVAFSRYDAATGEPHIVVTARRAGTSVC